MGESLLNHSQSSSCARHYRSKQPGNSLLYLLVIVTVMAVSLTGIIQILRPLQTYSSLTSDRRLMMEQLAQQHFRQIRLHIIQNSATYLNQANYDAPVTGDPNSPDYSILNNATWATVSGSIATRTSNTPDVPAIWRLNGGDLAATSTLARADLRRMVQGAHAGVIQMNLVVTSGPFSTNFRKRVVVTPDFCADAQTPTAETYTVPYASAAVPGTESFEFGTKQGPFIEFPG